MTTALNFGLRRAAARLTPDSAPDGELLSRFLASRDEAAFTLLVRRHAGMVFGTCRRVLGNVADADDAFQAAFVVLVRKAHSLTGRACVGNFLYGVAFHTALKARAMATKRRAKESKATRSESADAGELTRVLDEELAKLPDKYREPVVLCELDGVSRKDAAARLGIPEGTVSSRLATAHRMLHKRLAARGFAAVAVAAVLGNQAFAVPEGLADAAVRAAADGPPAGVTQLVSEVSKMLLWNKLKAGMVLTGVLLACGIGFGMAAKSSADDKSAVKAPAPKVEDKKKTVRDAFQGKWELTSVVIDEVDQKTPKASKWWTFDGDTLTETRPDLKGRVIENLYELDLSADPPQLILINGKVRRHTIFKLAGDTLVVCGATGSEQKNPPKGFTMKDAGEGVQNLTVQTFKRVKEVKDEDLIQGVWEAETVQVKGKQMPAGQVYKVMRWKFHGTALTIITEDGEGSVVFELDATASPKTLVTHEAGAKKAKAPHAIYDLDGDTLKVCHNTDEGDAGPLPTSFRAGPQDKDELIVFKRVKDEKKQPAKKVDDQKQLIGKWVTKAVTFDPPFPVPPGAKHIPAQHMLTFTDKELTWVTFTPDDVKTRHEQTKPYKLDQTTNPKELTSGDNECVYELDGDTLKVAMSFLTSNRPKGFNAKDSPPGKGHIILIELTREKDEPKKGEKLHGKWKQSGMTGGGVKVDLGTDVRHWVVGEDQIRSTTTNPLKHGSTFRYAVSPDRTPPELTTTNEQKRLRHHIYKLDGDTLTVAFHLETGEADSPPAPKGFTEKEVGAEAFKTLYVVTYERVKDDKQPEADKSYSLKDGEVLKLIPVPFPKERDEMFGRIPVSKRSGNPADSNLLAVAVGDGTSEVSEFAARRWKVGDSVQPPQLLHYVKHLLKIDTANVSDPNWLLESTVLDADVVLRTGARPDEWLTALSRELKAKCGIDLTLSVREVESDVVVLSGKHSLKRNPAFPGRPYNDAARVRLVESGTASRTGGTAQLPAELASVLGHPVVDESDLRTNDQAVWIEYPNYVTRPQAKDRDPEKVLKSFADQTGLTFKLERRKVRALVVAKADEPKAKPADNPLLGKWEETGSTTGGKPIPADRFTHYWDITADRLSFGSDNPKTEPTLFKYVADTAKTPAQLTLTYHIGKGELQFIYKLDGDTLTVARFPAEKAGHPAGFTEKDVGAEAFKTLLVQTFTRAKGPNEKEAKDEKLLGKWKEVEFTGGGVKGKQDDVHHWEISADAIRYTTTNPKKEGHTFTYTLATGRTPPELTTTNEQKEQRHHIYKLDGDTLTVAFTAGGAAANPLPAPKGFTEKEVGAEAFKLLCVVKYERVKDEKQAEDDKSYSLKDGEVLKLIPAPFPKEREEVFRLTKHAGHLGNSDQFLLSVTIEGSKPVAVDGGMSRGISRGGAGIRLSDLFTVLLRFDLVSLSDPDWLLQSAAVDCDVLLKKGATPDEWLPALRKELKAKCGVDLVLEFREAETEVVVISGKHTLKPVRGNYDFRNSNASVVTLFTSDKRQYCSGRGDGTSRHLAGVLAPFLGRPVVDESDLATNEVALGVTCAVIQPSVRKNAPVFGTPEAVFADLEEKTGLTFKLEKRKVKALVVAKANLDRQVGDGDKKPSAWKADFDKIYTLKDGEVLRYVPLTAEAAKAREDYYREVIARGRRDAKLIPGQTFQFVFGKEGATWRHLDPGANGGEGKTGEAVEIFVRGLFDGVDDPILDIEPALGGVYLPGDWVVRAGATAKERAAAFQKVLTDECKVPVTLELKDEEREVLVASGEWKLTPRAWRKDAVDVYALEEVVDKKLDGKAYLKGKGEVSRLLRDVSGFVGKRIMADEIRNAPKELTWYLHERNSENTVEQQEDHDTDAILKNVSDQIGLTFKTEKRKVPVLIVTKQ